MITAWTPAPIQLFATRPGDDLPLQQAGGQQDSDLVYRPLAGMAGPPSRVSGFPLAWDVPPQRTLERWG